MCFPDFCFSNRKAYDLYSPENLSGDHRKHRGKCENRGFSPALQMGQFHLKISPKNEKTDRRSGRRRIKKMVGIARFELATFCPPDKRANQAALYPVSLWCSIKKMKHNITILSVNASSNKKKILFFSSSDKIWQNGTQRREKTTMKSKRTGKTVPVGNGLFQTISSVKCFHYFKDLSKNLFGFRFFLQSIAPLP